MLMFLLYIVSYLLIAGSFFNDGFTSMFFSIPFISFLAFDSFYTKGRKKLIINFVAISILFILAITRFSNPYIYPILNEKLITKKDYVLTNYHHNYNKLVDIEQQKSSLELDKTGLFKSYKNSELYQEYLLKAGTLVEPVKVKISGHPDILGASYDLQININDSKLKDEFHKYILSNDTGVFSSDDNIYAGYWFFDNFPARNGIFNIRVKNIFEDNLCQGVMIFHPFFIWIYIIILFLQIRYLRSKIASETGNSKTT